jgi:hypothetical protein
MDVKDLVCLPVNGEQKLAPGAAVAAGGLNVVCVFRHNWPSSPSRHRKRKIEKQKNAARGLSRRQDMCSAGNRHKTR